MLGFHPFGLTIQFLFVIIYLTYDKYIVCDIGYLHFDSESGKQNGPMRVLWKIAVSIPIGIEGKNIWRK
jgi:hypothetical protein